MGFGGSDSAERHEAAEDWLAWSWSSFPARLNSMPDLKVGQNFFYGVTAIFLRVNILSRLALRNNFLMDKTNAPTLRGFPGNGQSGIEEFWCQGRIVPLRAALNILLNMSLSEKEVLLTIRNSFMIS
jgi:hypothetical protein